MGFSMKIAPGVRVRASSRGFSAGIGPRAARVHVGTRSVGVSSGVGPFSAYSHIGGGSRGRSGGSRVGGGGYSSRGPSRTTLAALEREARRAEKEQEIAQIEAIERALVDVHRAPFPSPARRQLPPAQDPDIGAIRTRFFKTCGVDTLVAELGDGDSPPKARDPQPVDLDVLRKEARREEVEGISFLKRRERRQARERADAIAAERAAAERVRREVARAHEQEELDAKWAQLQERRAEAERLVDEETRRLRAEAEQHRAEEQEAIDARWNALITNDPTTVITALEEAFADNGAPATPIDCAGATATVTMLYGHPDLIPERVPATTPSGKPTLRRRTKSDRNSLYLQSLASNVLATAKEGLAVCPGLEAISLLVVRRDPSDGRERLTAIYAGTFTRDLLQEAPWSSLDPTDWMMRPVDRCLVLKGQAQEVTPLDLSDEPELQSVLEHLASALGIEALVPRRRRRRSTLPPTDEASAPAMPGQEASRDDLKSASPDTRYDAVIALRDRRDRGSIELLVRAAKDPDRRVRQQAVGALGDLTDARCRPTLTEALADADADVRYEAVCGLREILDPSLADEFKRCAHDPDRFVRRASVSAIAELRLPSLREVVMQAAADADVDVRYEAICALADDPAPDAAAVLADAATDADRHLRRAALSGLGRLGDRAQMAVVAGRLTDDDPAVREAAAAALGDIGGSEAQRALDAAADDPDPDVRRAVEWAREALSAI